MFTQVKTSLTNFFIKLGRARTCSALLTLNDRMLEDMGFSRELLKQGTSAWPWRIDYSDTRSTEAAHKISQVIQLIDNQEDKIQQAIAELKTYTDHELADLNISRNSIEHAVRHGRPGIDENLNDQQHHPKAA